MEHLTSIVGNKLVSFFETREEAESENVSILQKFNTIAASLLKQMHASLGVNDMQMLLPLVESGSDSLLRQMYNHVHKHEKAFYYQEGTFFKAGPIVPVNKVSSLSTESEAAVWKYVRRLFYLSKVYIRNSPLGSLPYAGFITKLLPSGLNINTFLKTQCEKAMKNPQAALSGMIEVAKETMDRTGMTTTEIASMGKQMLRTHLGEDVATSIEPMLAAAEQKMSTTLKSSNKKTTAKGKE